MIIMENVICRVCGTNESLMRCAKCKMTYYCSANHQHIDWPNHKLLCKQISRQRKESQQLRSTVECPTTNITDFSFFEPSVSEMMSTQEFAESTIGNPYKVKTKFGTPKNNENSIISPSEKRYEELCRNIIKDLNTYGLSVIDDFLGMDRGIKILNEVHKMYSTGQFKDGQLVSNSRAEQDSRTIRGDKITWVKGTESGCLNIGYLINQIDALVCKASTMQDNGKLGNYKIRERTKAMVACYPGSGSHYVMHVDNPNRDGRIITAIYYLNINWDAERSGGLLRIFPENGGSVADIEPKFDRIIFFWSDRRNPHEVQPSHRTRYAITVWYFDANEREAALNRFSQYRHSPDCT